VEESTGAVAAADVEEFVVEADVAGNDVDGDDGGGLWEGGWVVGEPPWLAHGCRSEEVGRDHWAGAADADPPLGE
jgi:hypothetical protein